MQLKRTMEFEGAFKEIFLTIPSAAGMMTHTPVLTFLPGKQGLGLYM